MHRKPLLCLLSIILLAGACGPLPRPFQPEEKQALDLARYARPAELLVLPLEQDRPGNPRLAAAALAAALRDHGLPAATRSQVAEHMLSGRVTVAPLPNGKEQITIAWELREPSGAKAAAYEQRIRLPAGLWAQGQAAAVASVMTEAAAPLARLKNGLSAAETAASTPPAARRLVILPPETAPGDGNTSLAIALSASLRGAGVPVGQVIGENDLIVMGEVETAPAGPNWQDVHISWFVIRARDGSELGRIDQENRVPAGSLDGPWGPAAYDIARGATDGLIDLLRQIGPG